MADEKIDLRRPTNDADFKQHKIEKDMMVFSVVTGYPNPYVYAIFNPHLVKQNTGKLNDAGSKECRMFFSHPTNVAFMDAYRDTIKGMMRGKVATASLEPSDQRKDKVLKSLLNQAMDLVEQGDGLDPDTMKTVVEVFRKLNILKDEEERIEPARRYLPTRCKSECQYRLFVETSIEKGDIISECDYCRTRKFAEEQGWHYDPTKNLDLPNELTNQQNI